MAVDQSKYESARRGVNSNYSANSAANEYSRFISQQRGARQMGDQKRQFSRGWPKMQSNWGQRNQTGASVNSGFHQSAMQDYVGDYGRSRNRMMDDLQQEQNQFAMNQTRFETERDQALAQLELDRQRDVALLAQNIRAISPGNG